MSDPAGRGLADLRAAIFNQATAPVELNELVAAVAGVWQITEPQMLAPTRLLTGLRRLRR